MNSPHIQVPGGGGLRFNLALTRPISSLRTHVFLFVCHLVSIQFTVASIETNLN